MEENLGKVIWVVIGVLLLIVELTVIMTLMGMRNDIAELRNSQLAQRDIVTTRNTIDRYKTVDPENPIIMTPTEVVSALNNYGMQKDNPYRVYIQTDFNYAMNKIDTMDGIDDSLKNEIKAIFTGTNGLIDTNILMKNVSGVIKVVKGEDKVGEDVPLLSSIPADEQKMAKLNIGKIPMFGLVHLKKDENTDWGYFLSEDSYFSDRGRDISPFDILVTVLSKREGNSEKMLYNAGLIYSGVKDTDLVSYDDYKEYLKREEKVLNLSPIGIVFFLRPGA